jgi:O-antigen ligase
MTALAIEPVGEAAPVQTGSAAKIPWTLLTCSWVLMLACFSLPGRGDQLSVDSLDAVALLKVATRIGAFCVFCWLFVRNWRPEKSTAVLRLLAPLGLFIGWSLLSVLWSPLKTVSLGQVSGLVVLFLLAANTGVIWEGPADTRRMLGGLSCMLFLISCLLVFLYYALPEYGALSRAGWGVVHPTAAGSIAGIGLVLLVASRLLWGWKWSRWLLLPGVVAHVWLLYLANNRTSEVLAAGLVAGLFCLFAHRGLLLSLVVAGCVAAAAYLGADPGQRLAEHHVSEVVDHLSRGQKGNISELSGRSEMWEAVWNSYQQSPWIGHGYFVSSAGGEIYVWGIWGNWTAHNVFLQILVSTGLLGMVLFAAGIAYPSASLLRSATTPHARRLIRFAAAIGIWYLAWGMFNTTIVGPLESGSVVFFAVLGLVVGATASAAVRGESMRTSQLSSSNPRFPR